MARTLRSKKKFPKYRCLSDPCDFCMAVGTDRLSASDSEADPQFLFLKKHYAELRNFKRLGNWQSTCKVRKEKPMKLKDISCSCDINMEILNRKSKEERNKEGGPSVSFVLRKSKVHALVGHSDRCNVLRLNLYFRSITEYFTGEKAHAELYLLDHSHPVTFKQKAMREIRKMTVLKLRQGLEERLEDYDENMPRDYLKIWEKRNKVREYLFYILNNMLGELIGPDEDPTEGEGSINDGTDSDPEKFEYLRLKTEYETLKISIEGLSNYKKRLFQETVLSGDYSLVVVGLGLDAGISNEYKGPLESSSDSDSE